MRNNNCQILSGADNQNTIGTAIDASQLYAASFHAFFGDAEAAGTFKIQASNDPREILPAGEGPQNWVDVPTQTATIASGAPALLTIPQMVYRWIRALYTTTATGAQTISPIADIGVKQHQTVTTVADIAGSLNSKYFLLSSVNKISKAQKNFYMWFDDGGGVDPAIAGRTAIHITYSDGDSANTLATSMRTALNALTNDFVATGSNAAVIITDVAFGPVTVAADGAAPTGFTFGSVTLGVASNLNNKYFFLWSENNTRAYYVWMNVDGLGTDPSLAGKTGLEVDFSSGASAGTIGTAMATAIGAAHSSGDFTTSGTTTVTVTNQAAGPFTPALDNNSGFAFAVTAGGNTTVTVNMNAQGF